MRRKGSNPSLSARLSSTGKGCGKKPIHFVGSPMMIACRSRTGFTSHFTSRHPSSTTAPKGFRRNHPQCRKDEHAFRSKRKSESRELPGGTGGRGWCCSLDESVRAIRLRVVRVECDSKNPWKGPGVWMCFRPKSRASIDHMPGPTIAKLAPRAASIMGIHGSPGYEDAI